MNTDQFNLIVIERIEKITATLQKKAEEYATNNDRLHNFNLASCIDECSASQSLWGMAMKHLVSVIDLVNGDLENTHENANEKIGDLINYLILLEATLQEERNEKVHSGSFGCRTPAATTEMVVENQGEQRKNPCPLRTVYKSEGRIENRD